MTNRRPYSTTIHAATASSSSSSLVPAVMANHNSSSSSSSSIAAPSSGAAAGNSSNPPHTSSSVMESHHHHHPPPSSSSSSASRKVHVLYYLSRAGHVAEQPHLLEFSIPPNEGLYLRDVKKRLAMIRGSKLATTFSWSYRRNYKNMPVWQDLCDDDMIFPASGCEYMLKGSEILTDTDCATEATAARQQANASSSSHRSGANAGAGTTAMAAPGGHTDPAPSPRLVPANRHAQNSNVNDGTSSPPTASTLLSNAMVETGTDAATQTDLDQSEEVLLLPPSSAGNDVDFEDVTRSVRPYYPNPHSLQRTNYITSSTTGASSSSSSHYAANVSLMQSRSQQQQQLEQLATNYFHTGASISDASCRTSTSECHPAATELLHKADAHMNASPPNYISSMPNTPSPYYSNSLLQLQRGTILGGSSFRYYKSSASLHNIITSNEEALESNRSHGSAAAAAADAAAAAKGELNVKDVDHKASGASSTTTNDAANYTVLSNGSRTPGRNWTKMDGSMAADRDHSHIHHGNVAVGDQSVGVGDQAAAPESIRERGVMPDHYVGGVHDLQNVGIVPAQRPAARKPGIKHSSNLSLAAMIDLEQQQQQLRGAMPTPTNGGNSKDFVNGTAPASSTAASMMTELKMTSSSSKAKHSSGSLNLLQLMSCGSLDVKDQTLPLAHLAQQQQQQHHNLRSGNVTDAAGVVLGGGQNRPILFSSSPAGSDSDPHLHLHHRQLLLAGGGGWAEASDLASYPVPDVSNIRVDSPATASPAAATCSDMYGAAGSLNGGAHLSQLHKQQQKPSINVGNNGALRMGTHSIGKSGKTFSSTEFTDSVGVQLQGTAPITAGRSSISLDVRSSRELSDFAPAASVISSRDAQMGAATAMTAMPPNAQQRSVSNMHDSNGMAKKSGEMMRMASTLSRELQVNQQGAGMHSYAAGPGGAAASFAVDDDTISQQQQLPDGSRTAMTTRKMMPKAVSGEISIRTSPKGLQPPPTSSSSSSPLYINYMTAGGNGNGMQPVGNANYNYYGGGMKQMLMMEQGARSEHHPASTATAAAAGSSSTLIGNNNNNKYSPIHHHHQHHHKVASMPSKAFSEGEISCMVANLADLQHPQQQQQHYYHYHNSSSSTAHPLKSSPNGGGAGGGFDLTMAQIWEDLLAAPAKHASRSSAENHYRQQGHHYYGSRRPPSLASAERALQNAVDMSMPPVDHLLQHNYYCPHCGRKVKPDMMSQHAKNCSVSPKFNSNNHHHHHHHVPNNNSNNHHHHKGHSQSIIMLGGAMNSCKRLFRPSPK